MSNTIKQNDHDPVSHPAHYTASKVEVIDLVEEMDFCSGNAIKYIARHKIKHQDVGGQIEDLQKAKWYIDRLINRYGQQLQGITESEEVAAPTLGQVIAENVGAFLQRLDQVRAEVEVEVEEKIEVTVNPEVEIKQQVEPEVSPTLESQSTHTPKIRKNKQPKRQCGNSHCDKEPAIVKEYCSRACANRVYQREWYRNNKGKGSQKPKSTTQMAITSVTTVTAPTVTSPSIPPSTPTTDAIPFLGEVGANDDLIFGGKVVDVTAESVVVVNATPVEVEVEQKIEASPIPESRPTNQVHNHSNNQKVIEPSALPSSSTNTYKYRCTACQQIFHTIERQTTPARCTRPECISRRKQDKFSTLNKNSKQILEQYELKRVSSVE